MSKNKFKICCFSVLSVFGLLTTIASCNDRLIPPEPPIDEEVDGHFDMWNDEQKELMKEYCGEVLPYPVEMFKGTVTVNEVYDSEYNYYYLEIYDEATSFTLADYFYDYLEKFDWFTIKTYSGEVFQQNTSGTTFVELTKSSDNSEIGYDLVYFFNDGDTTSNVIKCYNDLTSKKTESTSWDELETSTIKETLTISLPFLKLGDGYSVSQLNYNTLQIYDYYVNDLTKQYADLLLSNGFTLNKEYTKQFDAYVLTKKLEDGSYIDILLTYSNGNFFTFYYTAMQTKHSSWPTEIIEEIKEKTGVTIPQFATSEGGSYYTYKKNDTYFIYTYNLSTTYNYETYAYNILRHINLTWNETINFTTYNLVDDDYNMVGFQVVASVNTPVSTFTSTYPTEKVNDIVSDLLKIDNVSLPEFDTSSIPDSDYKIKYQIRGEDIYNSYYEYYYTEILDRPTYFGLSDDATIEEIKALAHSLSYQEEGIIIDIYDINSQACFSYENIFYNLGWYSYSNEYGFIVYEDPTGTLAVTFDTYQNPSWDGVGTTEIFIHPGKGSAHSPEFNFKQEEYTVAIGQTKFIEVEKNMLPYNVTYSVDDTSGNITVDTKGNVSVKEETSAGKTATLTATLTTPEGKTYTATCKIVVTNEIVYTPVEAIDTLGALLENQNYTVSIEHPVWSETYRFDNLKTNLGSITIEEAKTSLTNNFIPAGFALYEDFSETTYSADGKEYSAQHVIYTTESKDYNAVALEYILYTINGETMLYVEAY